MIKIKFVQELLNSIFEKPIKSKSFNFFAEKKKSISKKDFIDNVSSAKGEVSALGYAELLMQHCEHLSENDLLDFFKLIRDNYEISAKDLSVAIESYKTEQSSNNLINLLKLSEPKRREIFRRCNGISRGTIRLVNIRKRLLKLLKTILN